MATDKVAEQVTQKINQASTRFDIDQWINDVLGSSSKTVQALLFFTAFYIIGVLCRRYLKLVFLSLAFTVFALKWFEYQQVIVVDWPAMKMLFGISESFDINILFAHFFEWVRLNIVNVAAGTIGFLLGYKPGHHQKGVAIKIAK